jgi:hypothetical protein
MDKVLHIEPHFGDPGLSGYECSHCGHVTSELFWPTEEEWESITPDNIIVKLKANAQQNAMAT